ncbi:MAG: hypothetical protein LC102_00640 [Ignavibacteriales bacterium]|nr:MAG: hypothetical protein F9K26_03640 [Ignavibacteriaceae bacterium]MBW7872527.1 hypothetical protein [Ignavibacteria bacterium]MCZ2141920.1 hypothetical protein [Ignavibacteriales bacterium]OQY79538.1 MAG: hypothetical protein B6D45_00680 [Ignavibacteriales bacterium UTCHB3]MBV6445086.1 hypothetical protein [Ignavibacteriaceae bacterium]
MANGSPANTPKTAFGRFMVYTVVERYANNIQGFVYMGAAVLIIIVGLRGLGTVAGELAVVPKFLLDAEGSKIDPNWVMAALFLEFFLLMILAVVTFFTPEDYGHAAPAEEKPQRSAGLNDLVSVPKNLSADLQAELEGLQNVADRQIKVVNGLIDQYNALNQKITDIQKHSIQALIDLKTKIS